MSDTRRHMAGVGLLLVVALTLLAWMALQVGAVGSLGERVHVVVRMADAAGIQPGAAVQVAGVRVGEVTGLTLDHDVALVALALDPAAGLRDDVDVRVRARSILGEKYLELAPGAPDAPPLATGDVLVARTAQLEIDELVAAVGPLVQRVDGEAIGEVLDSVARAVRDDPHRLERILRNLDALVADAATAAAALPDVVARADATLARVDRATVTLQARLDEARSPVARADRLLAELEQAAAPLDEALDQARHTLRRADDLLAELDGVGPDVRRILANFSEIDKWELRRLLREEGILLRMRPREVEPGGAP